MQSSKQVVLVAALLCGVAWAGQIPPVQPQSAPDLSSVPVPAAAQNGGKAHTVATMHVASTSPVAVDTPVHDAVPHGPGAPQQVSVFNHVSSAEDSFGNLLRKRVEVEESELQAKINSNLKAAGTRREDDRPPINAAPLPGAQQDLRYSEPVLEAIWGIEGQEVAEINYKGRRIPVSRSKPFVDEIDGWQLKSIGHLQVVLMKKQKGGKVIKEKVIPLSWQAEVGFGDSPGVANISSMPIQQSK